MKFEFKPELLRYRWELMSVLANAGYSWLVDFRSIDLDHQDSVMEVDGVRDEERARGIARVIASKFKWGNHNAAALAGLGMCHLKKFELDDAEEHFRKALAIQDTPLARQSLATVERLRKGKAWSDEEKRLKKFWAAWASTQLNEITATEQARLIAECFSTKH